MPVVFIRVPGVFIRNELPTSGPSHVEREPDVSCMPDETIWHENECHMNFLARRAHIIDYISIFRDFIAQLHIIL